MKARQAPWRKRAIVRGGQFRKQYREMPPDVVTALRRNEFVQFDEERHHSPVVNGNRKLRRLLDDLRPQPGFLAGHEMVRKQRENRRE